MGTTRELPVASLMAQYSRHSQLFSEDCRHMLLLQKHKSLNKQIIIFNTLQQLLQRQQRTQDNSHSLNSYHLSYRALSTQTYKSIKNQPITKHQQNTLLSPETSKGKCFLFYKLVQEKRSNFYTALSFSENQSIELASYVEVIEKQFPEDITQLQTQYEPNTQG